MPRKKTATRAKGVTIAQAEGQYRDSLLVRRDELLEQVAEVEEKLEALGAATPVRKKRTTRKKAGRKKVARKKVTKKRATRKKTTKKATKKTAKKRGRPAGGGRSGSMPTAVMGALKGSEMTVDDLIKKVGRLSSSSNKRAIVSQAINTLMKRGQIKRVSRGVYTAS
jgi:hypothetical protein